MPGTSFIMYAGTKRAEMGIIEHIPATAPNVFQRTITAYTYTAAANVVISDVRPVIENGAIKFLLVAYIGFDLPALLTVTTAYYRLYAPPSNNPVPTAIVCGANSITGCKTCGNGTSMNVNKCETCADGQGKIIPSILIWKDLLEPTKKKWDSIVDRASSLTATNVSRPQIPTIASPVSQVGPTTAKIWCALI